MTPTSKAREAAGVVLAGELNTGDVVRHIDHNTLFEVVEARTHYYGTPCVKMKNSHGGIQHFGLTTPFRRVT